MGALVQVVKQSGQGVLHVELPWGVRELAIPARAHSFKCKTLRSKLVTSKLYAFLTAWISSLIPYQDVAELYGSACHFKLEPSLWWKGSMFCQLDLSFSDVEEIITSFWASCLSSILGCELLATCPSREWSFRCDPGYCMVWFMSNFDSLFKSHSCFLYLAKASLCSVGCVQFNQDF